MKNLLILSAMLPNLGFASSWGPLKEITTNINGSQTTVQLVGEILSDSDDELDVQNPQIRVLEKDYPLWAISNAGLYEKQRMVDSPAKLYCQYLVGNRKAPKTFSPRMIESSDHQAIVEDLMSDRWVKFDDGFKIVVIGAASGFSPIISKITCQK